MINALLKAEDEIAIRCVEGLTDYIVLDLETTGFSPQNDEIIEIAMLKFSDGKYCSHFESLVNPMISIKNSDVHGLTNDDLLSAPKLSSIISDIEEFIGNHIIVGHNTVFDLSFLHEAFKKHLDLEKKFYYLDTCAIAQDVYPHFSCFQLQSLAAKLDIAEQTAHRAMSDIIVTHRLLHCCTAAQCRYTFEYLRTKSFSKRKGFNRPKFESINPDLIPVQVDSFDLNHPLYEKRVVFTGTCQAPREDLMQMAKNVGAIVDKGVTLKTNYLIVGAQDMRLVGEDGMSSKEEKAYKYNETGKTNILIIGEDDFICLINNNTACV